MKWLGRRGTVITIFRFGGAVSRNFFSLVNIHLMRALEALRLSFRDRDIVYGVLTAEWPR